jgi:hypothetical protein
MSLSTSDFARDGTALKEVQARIGTRGGERTDDIRASLRLSPVLSPGKLAVTGDIEAFLRKIEYWHQGSIAALLSKINVC